MKIAQVAALAVTIAAAAPALAQEAEMQPLSRSDFIVRMDAEFSRLDANRDGRVTAAEVEAWQRQGARNEAERQNAVIFDGLDTDRNGVLSREEFAMLANPGAIPVNPAPMMNQFDLDRDGGITLVEHRISTQANFDRIDGDRDGVVTPAEMRVAGIAQ